MESDLLLLLASVSENVKCLGFLVYETRVILLHERVSSVLRAAMLRASATGSGICGAQHIPAALLFQPGCWEVLRTAELSQTTGGLFSELFLVGERMIYSDH